jgi:hypothetical protein
MFDVADNLQLFSFNRYKISTYGTIGFYKEPERNRQFYRRLVGEGGEGVFFPVPTQEPG